VSLIVEALKKAQQGAARTLPPFSFKRPASGLPGGGWGEPPGRRLAIVAGSLAFVAVVVIAGLYLVRSKRVEVTAPVRPLVVVEQTLPAAGVPTPPAPVPAQPATPGQIRAPASPPDVSARTPAARAEKDTTIPEVRAALEAKKETPVVPARRDDPRREEALSRVKAALQSEARQAETAGPSGAPAAEARVQAAVQAPATPPIIEIRPEGSTGAAKFFADALRYQQQGQLARAIEAYEKSIREDPRNAATFNNLGVALNESGEIDQAIGAFEKALALDPKYEKALNNLGVIRYRKGQFDEALDLFKQALRVNPVNAESYTNLGIIYFQAQRDDDALEAFQQALRHDPKLAEAHYNLGVLWERRAHRENAQRHYQKFVELSSERHGPLVARVRERLQFLARGR
jgi:tetratricopeptide (TPR) repeat protein